jgi:hypothetical protein
MVRKEIRDQANPSANNIAEASPSQLSTGILFQTISRAQQGSITAGDNDQKMQRQGFEVSEEFYALP